MQVTNSTEVDFLVAQVIPEEAWSVILPEGIVGRFIPASGLIEAGFGVTVGKLDPGYGKRETIQFGLKNLKSKGFSSGAGVSR